MQSLTDPAAVAARFGLDPALVTAVAARYPVRLTPQLLTLIEGIDDPLGRQFLPDPLELAADDLADDPLAEAALAPLPRRDPPLPVAGAAAGRQRLRRLLPLLHPQAPGRLHGLPPAVR